MTTSAVKKKRNIENVIKQIRSTTIAENEQIKNTQLIFEATDLQTSNLHESRLNTPENKPMQIRAVAQA